MRPARRGLRQFCAEADWWHSRPRPSTASVPTRPSRGGGGHLCRQGAPALQPADLARGRGVGAVAGPVRTTRPGAGARHSGPARYSGVPAHRAAPSATLPGRASTASAFGYRPILSRDRLWRRSVGRSRRLRPTGPGGSARLTPIMSWATSTATSMRSSKAARRRSASNRPSWPVSTGPSASCGRAAFRARPSPR